MRHSRFDEGGMARTHMAQAGLAQYLDALASRRAQCAVIENDLARRTDPQVGKPIPTASLGDRVLHWCDLGDRTDADCIDIFRRGASGYPLNAFVTIKSSVDLGLTDGQAAAGDVPRQIAESLLAVIVAAFDAESFLVWTADNLN